MMIAKEVSEKLALMRHHRAMLSRLVDEPKTCPEVWKHDGAIMALEFVLSEMKVKVPA